MTYTPEQIEEAIKYHGYRLGSKPYYISDEMVRAKAHPERVVVFEEKDTGKLRAYVAHQPTQRTYARKER